jgi:hypothetical protein
MCTLANGEDYCIAGIFTVAAMFIGILMMLYVFGVVRPDKTSDVCELLRSFGMYYGSVITTGCTGKLLTNKAEPHEHEEEEHPHA